MDFQPPVRSSQSQTHFFGSKYPRGVIIDWKLWVGSAKKKLLILCGRSARSFKLILIRQIVLLREISANGFHCWERRELLTAIGWLIRQTRLPKGTAGGNVNSVLNSWNRGVMQLCCVSLFKRTIQCEGRILQGNWLKLQSYKTLNQLDLAF